MGGACSTYGGKEKCKLGLGGKTLRGKRLTGKWEWMGG
jgi:hypothetical protein